ncbi:MAG: NHLP-related RiPP peptide [Xanthomonadaceae bacterium]|jgi:putative modified peptide|nr:NHLP-related RiPP peptide [Xanthomonadaceae bacterium]
MVPAAYVKAPIAETIVPTQQARKESTMSFDARLGQGSTEIAFDSDAQQATKRSVFGLSQTEAARLVDRLGSDADFHALFAGDPEKALASMGLDTSMAKCLEGREVASMDAIRRAASSIADRLSSTATLAQSVHHLTARRESLSHKVSHGAMIGADRF